MRSNFFGDGITSEDPPSEIRLACELGVLLGDDLGEGERPPATGACVRGNDGVWGYVGGFNKKIAHKGHCGGLEGSKRDEAGSYVGRPGRNSHLY